MKSFEDQVIAQQKILNRCQKKKTFRLTLSLFFWKSAYIRTFTRRGQYDYMKESLQERLLDSDDKYVCVRSYHQVRCDWRSYQSALNIPKCAVNRQTNTITLKLCNKNKKSYRFGTGERSTKSGKGVLSFICFSSLMSKFISSSYHSIIPNWRDQGFLVERRYWKRKVSCNAPLAMATFTSEFCDSSFCFVWAPTSHLTSNLGGSELK